MRVGVELAHGATEAGINDRFDDAGDFAGGVQKMPQLPGGVFEAGDLGLALFPAKYSSVGELAATAGIEWRCRKGDLARPRIGDRGLDDQGFGFLMTEKMHLEALAQSAARLLVEIVTGWLPISIEP